MNHDTVTVEGFRFEHGGELDLDVAYAEWGSREDPTVLVCHALTGSQYVTGRAPDGVSGQAAGWWDAVVGPGNAIDTRRFHVVCANVPGSCYGTTGPASTDENGDRYGLDFPRVTVGDWTRSQAAVLDHLGVDTLHAVVGGSVGGMNAVDWAKRYPERVERVVGVATAARLDAQCLALNTVARRAITGDPDFQDGDYYGDASPTHGLAQARRVGHVMYLSKDSMRDRFGRRTATRSSPDEHDEPVYREVASYLDYNAERFTERFDANAYLRLLDAMDDYDLASGFPTTADALAGFDGDALLLSIRGDWHFTVEDSEHLADAFDDAGVPTTHRVLDSDYGHDAFLVEPDRVSPPVRAFLRDDDTEPDYPRVCTGLISAP
ncbi:homoserine O-acetyltransferase MetX [Halocalculus aciditolerans]|uniref:Homoserine O-acetyltransferase n=1 Tax=Halocalculus aciditolerans TaxID=1383812 RepID=A0A830F1V1_9EURY|nr:homoserine O-acetyltransferase [Halocalculus aciditolerans]GGL46988.1 homoserine O-acetyltransferase [Halocalculus aciditolerans]